MGKRHNHTIYCSSSFKEKVNVVCKATFMSASDLVKAMFLFSDVQTLNQIELNDDAIDVEEILFKSGDKAGQKITRRHRIQVVLPYHLPPDIIKKTLSLAITGKITAGQNSSSSKSDTSKDETSKDDTSKDDVCKDDTKGDIISNSTNSSSANGEVIEDSSLYSSIDINQIEDLFPDIIENVATIQDSLHMLGFSPNARITKQQAKKRYHILLKIFHPDMNNNYNNKQRLISIQRSWHLLKDS